MRRARPRPASILPRGLTRMVTALPPVEAILVVAGMLILAGA